MRRARSERGAPLRGQDARVAEDIYSVDEAARILKLTPGRIRQMLRAGEIEGGIPPEDAPARW